MIDFHVRDSCRLCSGSLTTVLELPDTPLANEYPEAPIVGGQDLFPLYLARCNDCGHVQLPVVVNPERLFRDYAYQSGTSPVFREHLWKFASDVIPSKIGGFVVEIGSNDGTLLDEYRARGYKCLGIDPARNLVELCNRRGLNAVAEFFNPTTARHILADHGPADLIVANNCLAHADNLAEIFEAIALLLAPQGELVFEVGYLHDAIENGLYRVVYHEHTSYHTINPLHRFCARFGLAIKWAERVKTQGGSIRLCVGHARNRGFMPLVPEHERSDVDSLARRIDQDRIDIRQKLDKLKAAGKVVCGYGSPAQLTTTCYALGITAEDIAFVCDDNHAKVGRYTPGRFIPIVSPENLRGSDACVIFSGNFADDIKRRHAEYRGQWIEI